MLIDAPPTLLNSIIHRKHLSHFMAKSMNELAHKSPLIEYEFGYENKHHLRKFYSSLFSCIVLMFTKQNSSNSDY